MKRIKNCTNTAALVLLLFVGIIMVLGAYRIFSWLCSASALSFMMLPPALAMVILAVVGFLLAYRSWRRLQYLRDHPHESDE